MHANRREWRWILNNVEQVYFSRPWRDWIVGGIMLPTVKTVGYSQSSLRDYGNCFP